jgi:hypothetical protein
MALPMTNTRVPFDTFSEDFPGATLNLPTKKFIAEVRMQAYRSIFRGCRSLSLALSLALSLSTFLSPLTMHSAPAAQVDPDADYDRMDGTGKSGETVNVIEWEGNLEIHVAPPGTLKGLALKLDLQNKNKPVMVIGYRFANNPRQQLIRRAILGITLNNGFKTYKDPTEGEFDKIIISNSGLSGQVALYRLDPAPTQLYPDGYPTGSAVAKTNSGNSGRSPASVNGGNSGGGNSYSGGGNGNVYGGNSGGAYNNGNGNGNGNGNSGNSGGNSYNNGNGNGYSGNSGGNSYNNDNGNGYSANSGGNSYNNGNGNGYSNNSGGNGYNNGNGNGYRGNSNNNNNNANYDGSAQDALSNAGGGYGNPSQEDAPPARRDRYPASQGNNSGQYNNGNQGNNSGQYNSGNRGNNSGQYNAPQVDDAGTIQPFMSGRSRGN